MTAAHRWWWIERPGLVAWAVLLSWQLYVAAPVLTDSYAIDVVWTAGFAQELAAGHLYPRWLTGSFGGLGAPVFDYYAPLAFYISGLLTWAGLDAYAAVVATMIVSLSLSGFAMRQWLGPGRFGLAGAVLFMAFPYHLTDVLRRGAQAETLAFALLPLLALGIRRAAAGRPVPLALAYAAVIASHLPLALLASLFLVVPMAGAALLTDRRAAWPIATGLALGLALAGAYLVPALTMQRYANIEALWLPGGAVAWNMLSPAAWISGTARGFIALIAAGVAVPACLLFAWRREPWAALALVCTVCAIGAVPGLFAVPPLSSVQFPWRLFAVAEFAAVTALVTALRRGAPLMLGVIAVVPAVIVSTGVFTFALPPEQDMTRESLLRDRPDVAEYLPHAAFPPERAAALAQALAVTRRTPPQATVGGWTVLRRFHHPRWRVACGGVAVPTAAQAGTGLLAYRGPPGCIVTARTMPAERAGLILSLAAALTAAGLAGRGASLRRRRVPAIARANASGRVPQIARATGAHRV